MSSKYLNYEIKVQISNTQNSVNDCAQREKEREKERAGNVSHRQQVRASFDFGSGSRVSSLVYRVSCLHAQLLRI